MASSASAWHATAQPSHAYAYESYPQSDQRDHYLPSSHGDQAVGNGLLPPARTGNGLPTLARGESGAGSSQRGPSAHFGNNLMSNAPEGPNRSRGLTSTLRKPRRAMGSTWIPSLSSAIFLAVVIIEALAVIGLVISVFAIVWERTGTLTQNAKTVPVFLSLFVFGMLFFVILALDAFRLHNTIQIVGCVVFNVALLVTAALEVSQVRTALQNQDRYGRGVPCPFNERRRCGAVDTLYPAVRPQLIATPVIIGAAQIPLTWLTFKLWQDFGWQIYKKIGADLMQRRRMLVYQIWVVMLKIVWVVGTAFCIAFLILVSDHTDAEFGITIAALPLALVALVLSAIAARREILSLMIFCILLMAAGVVYFVYKLTRIYAPDTRDEYRTVRLTLTFFSVLSIVALVATIVLAIWCTLNFNKGLKEAHENMGGLTDRLLHRRRSQQPAAKNENDDLVFAGKEGDHPLPAKPVTLHSSQHAEHEGTSVAMQDGDGQWAHRAPGQPPLPQAAPAPYSRPDTQYLSAPSHRTSITTNSSANVAVPHPEATFSAPHALHRRVSLD
ncbi:unnamed protein product [Parajaminaea phylloscopi]